MLEGRGSGAWLGVLMALCAIAPSSAHAEPGHDPARAEAAFQEALKLRNQGELTRACALFAESQRLDPARGTLLNIAMCHETDGALAEAWAAYRRLADESASAQDSERLAIAREALDRLDARVPRLVIELENGAARAELTVYAGGAVIARELYGTPFPVDPGRHTITASAPGFESWETTIDLRIGQQLVVEVPALARASEPRSTTAHLAPFAATPDRPSRGWSAKRKWAVASGGLALVAAGLGTYFGLTARSRWDDSGDHCNDSRSLCDATGRRLIDDANDSATYSNICFGVGAVAGLGVALLWGTSSASRASSTHTAWRLAPELGHQAALVTLTHSFF